MMKPVRETVHLSEGSATLRAWGADVLSGHFADLCKVALTLSAWASEGLSPAHLSDAEDALEPALLSRLERLIRASAISEMPPRLTAADLLKLTEAMWRLNADEIEEIAKAIRGLAKAVTPPIL